jgi:hypothetical protein
MQLEIIKGLLRAEAAEYPCTEWLGDPCSKQNQESVLITFVSPGVDGDILMGGRECI